MLKNSIKMKKIIAAFLFLLSFVLNAQAPKKFYTRFGGYGHDIGYGVVQTLNGQYAVTGSTSSFGNGNTDVYLALVDSMGWVRWEKSYGGFNNDIGRSIIQLKDSGFVIAGYTNSFGSGGYDVFAVRTDKNGNLIWQKAFGGFDWDFGYCVKESNGGDSLIICGNTYSFGYGKSDGYIIKTDINGNLQWQKAYGGADDDEFKSFTLTYNNQYAFAGTTKSMGDTKGDCWLMKTNLGGDSLISYSKQTSRKENINDINETNDKGFILCGGADTSNGAPERTDSYLLKVDEFGNFQWERPYGLGIVADDQHHSMTKSKTTNETYAYVRKTDNGPQALDPNLMLLNSGGYYIAQTSYGSLSNEELFCIESTRDKGYILFGYTFGYGAQLSDFYLLKTDSSIYGSNSSMISVDEVNKPLQELSVFPTITSDIINIKLSGKSKILTYFISDLTGKLITERNSIVSDESINVTNLIDGVYFLTIDNGSIRKSFKFVKLK